MDLTEEEIEKLLDMIPPTKRHWDAVEGKPWFPAFSGEEPPF